MNYVLGVQGFDLFLNLQLISNKSSYPPAVYIDTKKKKTILSENGLSAHIK